MHRDDNDDPFGLGLMKTASSSRVASSNEDRKKQRKSLGRRVSFAAHAHVRFVFLYAVRWTLTNNNEFRLFEKHVDVKDSPKSNNIMDGLDLGVDTDGQMPVKSYEIPDLSSVRRNRFVIKTNLVSSF
jgi:hypothetical protein